MGELRRLGIDVRVAMPDYGGVALEDEERIELKVPKWVGPAFVRRGVHAEAGALDLVAVEGMARPHPYLLPNGEGFPDNDERFLKFSAAVAALTERDAPDVLHLNDWHTATALAALESL